MLVSKKGNKKHNRGSKNDLQACLDIAPISQLLGLSFGRGERRKDEDRRCKSAICANRVNHGDYSVPVFKFQMPKSPLLPHLRKKITRLFEGSSRSTMTSTVERGDAGVEDKTADPSDAVWKGFPSLRYLFVFGDSYSAVGYSSSKPIPTDIEPLGVAFPGENTWTGFQDSPNWVGYLVTEYSPSKLLVYDYAVGGHTVDGVRGQFAQEFLPHAGKRGGARPWKADDSLFITWVGINDIALGATPSDALERLFIFQGQLYDAGARNFLFMNIPPLPRAESTFAVGLDRITQRRNDWNRLLEEMMDGFTKTHSGSTAFLFDAHACFQRMFDDPEKYGFPKDSGRARDGRMYWDHIHPTTELHAIIAREIGEFLAGAPLVEPVGGT